MSRLADTLLARLPRSPVPRLISDLLDDDPISAVDVGAARGVPWHWRPFLDHLRVDAFEPNASECARLAARSHPNIQWHPTALAGASGPRDLYVLATPTGSSLLRPAGAFVERFGVPSYSEIDHIESLECITLEEHLGARPGPKLIKLDTQGTELEILSGLRSDQLADVLAIEVETELHEVYDGQPLFPDVHDFMVGAGLQLLDFRVQRVHLTGGVGDQHYLRRHLSTAVGSRELTAQVHALDALYIRPLDRSSVADDAVRFAQFATILQMYRYYDGIFWLLDRPAVAQLLGARAQLELTREYERSAPRPRFLQRTGRLPHVGRRAKRAASLVWEAASGKDGFDPPRAAWSRAYWPDT